MEKPQGMSMIQILVIVLLVALVGAGVFLVIREERAHARDAKRMADMARLSAAFFELYATEGSYASAASGCATEGTSVATCNLKNFLSDIATFKDPKNITYKVVGVPGEASFVISFTLERSYGKFTTGSHVLTPEGIK